MAHSFAELNLFFEAYLIFASVIGGICQYKLGNDHRYFQPCQSGKPRILDAISKAASRGYFLIHAVVFGIGIYRRY